MRTQLSSSIITQQDLVYILGLQSAVFLQTIWGTEKPFGIVEGSGWGVVVLWRWVVAEGGVERRLLAVVKKQISADPTVRGKNRKL